MIYSVEDDQAIRDLVLYALKQDGKRRGVASLCIGGGEAVALMVER